MITIAPAPYSRYSILKFIWLELKMFYIPFVLSVPRYHHHGGLSADMNMFYQMLCQKLNDFIVPLLGFYAQRRQSR